MKKSLLFIYAVLISVQIHATETWGSEGSHFAGATLLGAGATIAVDQFDEYREDRKMIGFTISSVYGVIDQGIQYIDRGNAGGQLLDLGVHILGSAFGAWLTDKYILSPVIVEASKTEGKYIGFNMQYSF